RYETAFAGIDAPFALVDLDAMWANARDMLASAAGKPIRVASKSVRCRELIGAVLGRDPGFRGLMTFTLRESLFLSEHGFSDLLLAYSTTDREAIRALSVLEAERPAVLMVDSTDHLDLIEAAADPAGRAIRVCIEIDLSYRLPGGTLIGPKRSPIRTAGQ